jgi:hypothetical protein
MEHVSWIGRNCELGSKRVLDLSLKRSRGRVCRTGQPPVRAWPPAGWAVDGGRTDLKILGVRHSQLPPVAGQWCDANPPSGREVTHRAGRVGRTGVLSIVKALPAPSDQEAEGFRCWKPSRILGPRFLVS